MLRQRHGFNKPQRLDHSALFPEGVLLALVKKHQSYTNLFVEIMRSPWNSEDTVSASLP